MPLTVVTGRANAGKTGEAYAILRAALDAGQPATLLLPSAADVVRARREFARDGAVGLRISQFDRHLEGLWRIVGDGRLLVQEAQRIVLLRAAVADAGVEGLGDAVRSPGFARMLSSIVRRFPGAGGGKRAVSTMGIGLVAIFERYREALSRAGLVEPAEAFGLLASAATATLGPLVVHRFTDFTPEQERFLVAQSQAGADVYVTLPHACGFAPTAALDQVVARLGAVGEVVELRPDSAHTPSSELRRVEALLFGQPEPEEPRGDVRLVLAAGDEGEGFGIAAETARLIAQGTPPEAIAVVFRDPARHLQWTRRAMGDAGIAVDLDMRVPLRQVPLGRAVLHLLRYFTEGHQRRDLLAFLRSASGGAAADLVDRAEARWRGRREDQGLELLTEARACGAGARAVLRVAERLASRPVDGAALRDWQWLLDTLFRTAHPDAGSEEPDSVAQDAAAHRVVLEAVGGMIELGGAPARFADVRAAAEDLFVTPADVERVGHVQLIDAERARFRRFDAVIIGGMTASEFPRRGGGGGFGSEAAADAAALLGLPTAEGGDLARERLLLYQLVTRAKRTLVLVRQQAGSDGRPLRESVFWDELMDLYRFPEGDDTSALPEGVPVRRLAESGRGGARRSIGMGSGPESDRGGRVTDEGLLERLTTRDVFSASDIESYLRCPYRWFFERELRPASLDAELDPRATGTVVHEALRSFYEGLEAATGSRRVTGDGITRALELVDAAFSEAAALAPEPRDLVEEERIHRARLWARRLVVRDAEFLEGWEPSALEWSFGSTDEPETFAGFRLKGKVDRIDSGPTGLVVMDYKSSQEVAKLSDFDRGIVQIPLYAEVVRRRFGEPVVAGLYRSLRRSRNADRGFFLAGALTEPTLTRTDECADAEAFAEVVAAAETRAGAAVAGMRAGIVTREPLDPGECAHCAARHGCGGRRT